MLSTAHILETALLILVAFLVGCVVGAVARRLTLSKPASPRPAEAPAAVAASGPQLVVAPTIAPIARSRPTPEERIAAAAAGSSAKSEPDRPRTAATAETQPPDGNKGEATPAAAIDTVAGFGPAHAPGAATSTRQASAIPAEASAASESALVEGEAVEGSTVPSVEPEPLPSAVRAEDVPPIDEATHVLDRPVQHEVAEAPEPTGTVGTLVTGPEADEPDRPAETAPEHDVPSQSLPSEAATPSAAVPPAPEDVVSPPAPEWRPSPAPIEDQPDRRSALPPADVDDPAPPATEDDEAAAMRAIEGGWTPSAIVAPQQPAPEPELSRSEVEAAMASARLAVASAAAAAEAALAEPPVDDRPAEPPAADGDQLAFAAVEGASLGNFLSSDASPAPAPDGMDFEPERPRAGFGRPPTLAGPRDGGKDNLRQIAGVTPDIEASLNHLGIYHYDQVAGWDHKAVVWLDHHLTLRGRIGREKWIDQAKALAGRRPTTARPVRR